MRSILASAVALGVLAAPAAAQEMPKPGPEHAQLAHFVGTWKYEGTAHASPMGPGGPVTGMETCAWFEGKFHVVCRTDGTGPRGPFKAQGIMTYDANAKNYTYYGITSMGDGFLAKGAVAGKVWTWTAEGAVEGMQMKFRATGTVESPTNQTFKLEMSMGTGPWTVLEEGRSTKQP